MKIQESAENYLEAILMLGRSGAPVRSVDIAEELGFSRPSVSVAMKNLRAAGHVEIDAEGYVTLTERGCEIAQTMYERHVLISDWLIFLGVERGAAVRDACRLEHYMSEESFLAIKRHIENWKSEIYQQRS